MVWLVNHALSYVLVCVHSVPLQDGLSDETHESDAAPEAGAKLEANLDDEADAKEYAEDAKDAEDEDNVVSEEGEEEEEDESHEDDDADEHDSAAHLHVKLTSKEREKIWSQETLLLETVRRQKCQRWSLVCKGFWTSDGCSETGKDYSRLIVTSYDGATGQIDTALLARFQQGLKQHYNISVSIEPTHAPIYCLPVGVVTRLSVGDPGSNMSTSVSALQPLLRLRNAQELHLKGNSRNLGFLLLWSTIKGARLNPEDAENHLEATASVGGTGSDAFAREVHSKLGKMKRSLADMKTQQEELGKKQNNLSSAVVEARDLIRSMKDDLESLTKRAKPAPVTAPAPAWLWPGVQPRMAQSMELALAQNIQSAQNATQ